MSKHTSGQLILLIAGTALWEKASESEQEQPKEKESKKHRKHKPFKEMTAFEYDQHMRAQGV